jgi:DNA (cytosine-5)-methyltransferase 1
MNYISLFSSSGVGCFGFKQEGFDGVATSELIERRLNVQRANKKVKYSDGYILGDITEQSVKNKLFSAVSKYKFLENTSDIDVIIFTAPCQGMSVANHKKNDGTIERNSLVVEALEIVKEIKPKFFISENVRAFMNTKCIDHDSEKKISAAFSDWLSEDYLYESRVINFKDYGANSSRTRTLVIGVRNDLSNTITPDLLYPTRENPKILKEVIGYLPSLNVMGEICSTDIYHSFKSYREDMRSWIQDVKQGRSAFENEELLKRPHRVVNGEIIPNVQKNGDKYTRQRWDSVAPCIHTRNDIMASQNTVHPVDDRVFSIRELMLMMNIPRNFKWSEVPESVLNAMDLSDKEKYLKQNEINIRQSIGEAVPTIIMQKIAKNIKVILNEVKREEHTTTDKRLQPSA